MKAGWTTASLAEVCDFQRGLTYAKSDEVDASRSVVLRASNIDLATSLLDLGDLRFISDTVDVPANKRVREGSLLVCTASGSKAHLGKVALIDKDYGFAFGGFMGQLTPAERVLPKFLFYMLISDVYKHFIASLSDGANINNLKFADLGRFQIPVPPLPEQRRIVALLDAAFEGLATAAANAERNLQNARELFESHLAEVFGRRGEGWVDRRLGELCEVLDSRRKPITKRDRLPGPIPYYGATGVQDYIHDFIFDEPLVLVGEDGAKWASGDRTAFAVSGKCWVNNHAHVLRPHRKQICDYWLTAYLFHLDLSPFVSGLTVPKLTQASLREISIPIPPLVEQLEFAHGAERLEGQIQRLSRIYEQKQFSLAALKRSLLHQAFSGAL